MRVQGRTHWNWVFQNGEVVIHVIRPSRGRAVVLYVLGDHRPEFWVSDLYSAQRGHADAWQICLAHQLRDLRYAIKVGDSVFAPRMKALVLRAVILARRRFALKESTRVEYRRRLERDLDAILALAPTNRHGKRLRKRYLAVRDHLFTFLSHPEVPPDNNGSERGLRPMAMYRKVTGDFRSDWGAVKSASEQHPVVVSMPNMLSLLSYPVGPSFRRVEQILRSLAWNYIITSAPRMIWFSVSKSMEAHIFLKPSIHISSAIIQ